VEFSAVTGEGTDELKLAAVQLLRAVVGEFLDQAVLPCHHGAPVERHVAGLHSPQATVLCEVPHLGGIEQCLRGHATAQDTKAADFFATFNDDSTKASPGSGSRRCVAATAATDNGNIVIEAHWLFTHGVRRMGGGV